MTTAVGVGFYFRPWFSIKKDKDLLYESMIRILMTSPGERVMSPSFGAGIRRKLFQRMSPDVLQDLAVNIHSQLRTFEPRVIVVDVQTQFIEPDILSIHVISEKATDPTQTTTTTFNVNINTLGGV
jgi:uncharacterized protein